MKEDRLKEIYKSKNANKKIKESIKKKLELLADNKTINK